MNYTSELGKTFELERRTNSSIFKYISEREIVKPKVPQYYMKQRDVYIDNPDHPSYRSAMELREYEKSLIATDAVLVLAMTPQQDIIDERRRLAKYRIGNVTDNDVWLDYLRITLTLTDISNITKEVFLTENATYGIMIAMSGSVYRSGVEILDAHIKNAVNTSIELDSVTVHDMQIVHPLDEYNACVGSNISWEVWEQFDNNKKAEILALFRLSRIVENHSQDEIAIDSERRSKS